MLYTVAWSGVRPNFGVCDGSGVAEGAFIGVSADKRLEVRPDGAVELGRDGGDSSVVVDADGVKTKVLDGGRGVGGEEWIESGKRSVVDSEYGFWTEIEMDERNDSFIGFGAGVAGILFFECSDVRNGVGVETDLDEGRGEDDAEVYSVFDSRLVELGFVLSTPLEEIECKPASLI